MFAVFPLNDFYLAGSWFKKQKQKKTTEIWRKIQLKKLKAIYFKFLATISVVLLLYRPMFPSYRNQSVDLQSKSSDWFLYDGDIGR